MFHWYFLLLCFVLNEDQKHQCAIFFPWGIEFNYFPDEKVRRKKAEMDFSCSLSQIILGQVLVYAYVSFYFYMGSCMETADLVLTKPYQSFKIKSMLDTLWYLTELCPCFFLSEN